MGKTKYLSEAEKQLGRKHMYLQEFFNGVAYSLLGDTIVYLLAIYFGAGNLALGYIASASYIAGAVLPFIPLIFKGKNQIKVQSSVWLLRGVVCFGYVGLFFLTGDAAVLLLLGIYTIFNIFRMVGIALNDFTMKSISSVSNRGKVVGNVNVAYQSSSMVVRCITALVLGIQQFSGLVGLIGLQIIGAFMNFFAAHQMSLIPSRSTIVHNKGRTVFTIFREAMGQSSLRRRLFLRWLSTSVSVIFGLTVPFLRIELALSNSMVVLYSVVLGLAVVAASYISKQFSDRLGSRPLVFLSTLFSLFFFLLWALITPQTSPVVFFFLGFFTNFFVALISLLVFRLLAQVMPDDDAVGFNSMANFVIAIVAFGVGIVSGLLADSGDLARSIFTFDSRSAGNGYTLVFLFAMVLTAVEALVAAKLQEVGAYSSQAAAAVVFSMHGLKAVSMIEKLEKETDPAKRRFLMHSLGSNYNNMATSEIRSILASPFSSDKIEAVRALADRPRKSLLDDLITIARDDDSYVQLDAIAALGSYKKDPKVKEVMLQLLKYGRWSSVRSMASKTLARITESTEYLPLVNELSHNAKHIDEVIDFLIAKRHMDKEGTFYQEFFLSVEQGRSSTFRQTRYAVIASFLKFGSPRLSTLFEQMNTGSVKDFLSGFLTEARDLNQIDLHYDEVHSMFTNHRWDELRTFCLGILDDCNVSFDPNFENLKIGILKSREMDIKLFDMQDALAGLYFCYSLGKNAKV
ncbi:MFS transporter [Sphaerochaeta sp. PS]|uniref:MFS transporter n=1 Tax=Sphaerochaeta sp. PS TaxID=3076336 RepID=UPI0028A3B4B9|nr:MFS transporter [Sphaerochaeta sp. PS]MDT4761179.1 MFS transporter [Sphaerochaeta sp. PS]